MSEAFDAWVAEYKKLRGLARELEAFVDERYEVMLREVAREYAESSPGLVREPCWYCVVQVTTLIESQGWYFEWECRGHMTPIGRCGSDTFGWHVPLEDIRDELAMRSRSVP